MKVFELWDKKITLDIGEELTVKELRKIYPLLQNGSKGDEIEMMIGIAKALSSQEDVEMIIDGMTTQEFTDFGTWIGALIDIKKKWMTV